MSDLLTRVTNAFSGDSNDRGKPKGKSNWGLQGMSLALLAVTGYFTWDYLWNRIGDKQFGMFIAIGGLAAFDLGALLWSGAWKSHSSNEGQDRIARAMFYVDVAGMILTTLGSFVDESLLPQLIKDISPVAVAIIIVLNVVAKFEYDNQSDAVEHAREYRRRMADLNRSAQTAEIEIQSESSKLHNLRAAVEQAELLASLKEQIALAELRTSATDQGLARARLSGEHIEAARDAVQQHAVGGMLNWAKEKARSNGPVKKNDNGNGNGNGNGHGTGLPNA